MPSMGEYLYFASYYWEVGAHFMGTFRVPTAIVTLGHYTVFAAGEMKKRARDYCMHGNKWESMNIFPPSCWPPCWPALLGELPFPPPSSSHSFCFC